MPSIPIPARNPIAAPNLLLASLSPDDRAWLEPHLDPVALLGGERISGCSSAPSLVWFPDTMIASFQAVGDVDRFEVGMVGREGLVGWPVLLGAEHHDYSGIVLLDGGTAHALPAATLVALCGERRSLHLALLRFVQSVMVQMSRTIVANLRDGIGVRLARWLLMLHDRVDGDALAVTHVELAAALHVRRASITDWLHVLEGNRVLRCTRGQIVIRDRSALREVAGDSYGTAESTYRTLIAPFGKG